MRGVSAIAFLLVGILPGQAAELQHRSPMMSSSQAESTQADLKQLAPEEGTAEDLMSSPASVLHGGESSELPTLEPSVPIDQPVSVPPITPLEASVSPTTVKPTELTEPTEPTEVATEAQNEPEIPSEPPFIGDLAIDDLDQPTAQETTPSAETLASSSSSPPSISPAVVDSVDTGPAPPSAQNVRPANVSRWPDPIPYGQPLPNN